MKIPEELVWLIEIIIKNSQAAVMTKKGETEDFGIILWDKFIPLT